jgi:hypothetical protein
MATLTNDRTKRIQDSELLEANPNVEWLHFVPSSYLSGASRNKILWPRGKEISLSNPKKIKSHELFELPDVQYIHN